MSNAGKTRYQRYREAELKEIEEKGIDNMPNVGHLTRRQYEDILVELRAHATQATAKDIQERTKRLEKPGDHFVSGTDELGRALTELEERIKNGDVTETEEIKKARSDAQKVHEEAKKLRQYAYTLDDDKKALLDKALAAGLKPAQALDAMTSVDQTEQQKQQAQILAEIQTRPKAKEDALKLDKYRSQLDDDKKALLDKALATGLTPTQVVGAFTAVDQAARQKEQDRILAEIREGKKEEQEPEQPASHQLPAQIQVNQQKSIWKKYIIDPEN